MINLIAMMENERALIGDWWFDYVKDFFKVFVRHLTSRWLFSVFE
ncbi:MAG: hypothetical protein NVS4B9_37190 [Ktedonobacteraceae bacterium]